MDREAYLRASEIGDFVYCRRGWWLRRKGLLKDNFAMQKGNIAHDSIFRRIARIKLIQTILIWSGLVILSLIAIVLLFL